MDSEERQVSLGFFFFKQKTAYEMRISDWSSDVCSSDLDVAGTWVDATLGIVRFTVADTTAWPVGNPLLLDLTLTSPTGAITTSGTKIGRASCRERVCQYV